MDIVSNPIIANKRILILSPQCNKIRLKYSYSKVIICEAHSNLFAWFVLQVCQCAWQLIMRMWRSGGDIRCQMSSPHVRCQTRGHRVERRDCSDLDNETPGTQQQQPCTDLNMCAVIDHELDEHLSSVLITCSVFSISCCPVWLGCAGMTGLCLTNELWNLTLNAADKHRIAITGHPPGIIKH